MNQIAPDLHGEIATDRSGRRLGWVRRADRAADNADRLFARHHRNDDRP
jgi:hypothetical protein